MSAPGKNNSKTTKIILGVVSLLLLIILLPATVVSWFENIFGASSLAIYLKKADLANYTDEQMYKASKSFLAVDDDMLKNLMIDRKSLKAILKAVVKYNDGTNVPATGVAVVLKEYGTDSYDRRTGSWKEEQVYRPGFDYGGYNRAHVEVYEGWQKKGYVTNVSFSMRYTRELIFPTEVPAGNAKDPQNNRAAASATPTCTPVVKYTKDDRGSWVKIDRNRYGWIKDVREIEHLEFVKTHSDYISSYKNDLKEYSENDKLGTYVYAYASDGEKLHAGWAGDGYKWSSDGQKDGRGKEFTVRLEPETLYKDYPLNWKIVYTLCMFRFIDQGGSGHMESFTEEDEDGNIQEYTMMCGLSDDDVEDVIKWCYPQIVYATVNGQESCVLNALQTVYKNQGAIKNLWYSFLSDTWLSDISSVELDSDDIDYTDILAMYGIGKTEKVPNRLLAGKPVKVIVKWTLNDVKGKDSDDTGLSGKYAFEYNWEWDSEKGVYVAVSPVVHTTTLYYPRSTLKYIRTPYAKYTYSENETMDTVTIDTTSVVWSELLDADGKKMEFGDYVGREIEKRINGQKQQVIKQVFDLQRTRMALLGTEENQHTISDLIVGLSELPNGGALSAMIECAEKYEGMDITAAVSLWNKSGKAQITEHDIGLRKEVK